MLASVFLSSSNFGVRVVGPGLVIGEGMVTCVVSSAGDGIVAEELEGVGCGFVSSSLCATESLATALVNRLPNSAGAPSVGWVPLFLFVMEAFSRTTVLLVPSLTDATSSVSETFPSCRAWTRGGSGDRKGAPLGLSGFAGRGAAGGGTIKGSLAGAGLEDPRVPNIASLALQRVEGRCSGLPHILQYLSRWSTSTPHWSQ